MTGEIEIIGKGQSIVPALERTAAAAWKNYDREHPIALALSLIGPPQHHPKQIVNELIRGKDDWQALASIAIPLVGFLELSRMASRVDVVTLLFGTAVVVAAYLSLFRAKS